MMFSARELKSTGAGIWMQESRLQSWRASPPDAPALLFLEHGLCAVPCARFRGIHLQAYGLTDLRSCKGLMFSSCSVGSQAPSGGRDLSPLSNT